MREVSFVTPLHISSKRDYFARITAEKPECMRVAKQFDFDYWDGERCFGYGGYRYDGRWKSVAEAMVKHYHLKDGNKILDIGCGKGCLLYEFSKIFGEQGIDLPIKTFLLNAEDISEYAIKEAKNLLKKGYAPYKLNINNCINSLYRNAYFDFTYSINVFHNLGYKDLKQAIREMVRVTKPDGKSYICVESYRTEEELCNLECWALTCASFYTPDDWKEILTDNGYKGDLECIFFN